MSEPNNIAPAGAAGGDGQAPTDEALLQAYRDGGDSTVDPSTGSYDPWAGHRAGLRAVVELVAARYRAELDRRVRAVTDEIAERDSATEWADQLAAERAAHQATREELAKVRGHAVTAAKLYPERLRAWRDRADKLAAELTEVRGWHDDLIEKLAALIPEDEMDDAAIEYVIVEWVKRQIGRADKLAALAEEAIGQADPSERSHLRARLAELRAAGSEATARDDVADLLGVAEADLDAEREPGEPDWGEGQQVGPEAGR